MIEDFPARAKQINILPSDFIAALETTRLQISAVLLHRYDWFRYRIPRILSKPSKRFCRHLGPSYLLKVFCKYRIGQCSRGLSLALCVEKINPELSIRHLFEAEKHGRHLHLLACVCVWGREWLETEGFTALTQANERFNKRTLMNNN